MPFHTTYEINNREEGKAAQRDQSYRSCIIALLIFFFLCLILIIGCIPWKVQNLKDDTNQHIAEQKPQYGKQEKQTTSPSTRQKIPPTTTSTTTREKTTKKHINIEEHTQSDVVEPQVEPFSQTIKNEMDEITTLTVPEEKAIHHATTTEEILYTKSTEKDIGLTVLHDVMTDNSIDNDITSSDTQMVHTTTTIKHHVSVVESIVTPTSAEENTTDDSSNAVYNTMESTFVTEDSTNFDKFKTEKLDIVTEGSTASTTQNLLTDVESGTVTRHIFDKHYYREKSQFNTTINNLVTSTSPVPSVSEEYSNTEEFIKYSNDKESMISNDLKQSSISQTVTTESSTVTEKKNAPFIDERLSIIKETTDVTKIEDSTVTDNYNTTETYNDEKYNEQMISVAAEKYTVFSRNDYTTTTASFGYYDYDTTILPENQNTMHISTTENVKLPQKNTDICETGRCKQFASKMLSYMNHSADPCEDFYEYACGGFEANPQLVDEETVLRSRNYQRIARQISKKEYKDSTFATYYDSCVQYEKKLNFSERAKMASDSLSTIGKFYIPATWSNDYVNFTDLFTQLILHDSTLLFDIVPKLNEHSPNSFTLKIGPALYESSFMNEYEGDSCFEDEFETKERYVDLKVLYNKYKRCKNDTRELMKSIKEALIVFNVFKGTNDNYLEWHAQLEYIEKTVHIIESIIMQEYFSEFPSKNGIKEDYSTSNYKLISLEELENSCTFINWMQLINSLGINGMDGNVQVYVYTTLIESLQKLEKFSINDPMSLNNAIMGLYAHKLYRELVVPRRNNIKDHCLQMAIRLLRLEASSLYISSFDDHEIIQMNKLIEDTFNELKQTLRLEMENAQWVKEEGRKRLLKKIDSLKLALPAIFYFQDTDSLYNEYDMPQILLHDNYFNNSIILLKRYRTLMYAELKGQVDHPKQIWTYYATPFQSQARVIYNLNLNVIPYGIIDWSVVNNEFSFKYFILATLGNLIAHQIAHHFDANGIYYWNHIKNSQDTLMYDDYFADTNFEDYLDCQNNSLYQGSMNIMLPFTDQIVSYTIPQFTLNERLSDIMGLRLAYDTLVRTMSDAEERLPWITFRIEQLFYLAYAQMYCTKKPLTSSYVSLYESENLPSRIRVFVSTSNNKPLAEMWNCPTGSQIAPIDVCSVFPYLDFKMNGFTISQ